MTDHVINSNMKSAILMNLATKPVDYAYKVGDSAPIMAKSISEISPDSGGNFPFAMNQQKLIWKIPKADLVYDAVIKVQYTTTTAADVSKQYPAIDMTRTCALKSNNKTSTFIDRGAMKCLIDDLPSEARDYSFRGAAPLTVGPERFNADSTTACVSYLRIPFSFFQNQRKSIDVYYYEQLSLEWELESPDGSGLGAVQITGATLFLYTKRYSDEYKAVLRSKNQDPAKNLNILTWSTFTEAVQCYHATTNKIKLNNTFPVIKTFVSLVPTKASYQKQPARINSLSITLAGKQLWFNVPTYIAQLESGQYSSSTKVVTTGSNDNDGTIVDGTLSWDDNKAVVITWNLDPSKDDEYCSGGFSFANVGSPEIEVKCETMANFADYELLVVHKYLSIVEFDNMNGSVSKAIEQ